MKMKEKENLFDELNNILFETFDEIVETIEEWFVQNKIKTNKQEIGDLASEFIDKKELYDIDYGDDVRTF